MRTRETRGGSEGHSQYTDRRMFQKCRARPVTHQSGEQERRNNSLPLYPDAPTIPIFIIYVPPYDFITKGILAHFEGNVKLSVFGYSRIDCRRDLRIAISSGTCCSSRLPSPMVPPALLRLFNMPPQPREFPLRRNVEITRPPIRYIVVVTRVGQRDQFPSIKRIPINHIHGIHIPI